MGKLINYVSLLIFADLLFIITGQLCASGTCSLGSIIFNAVLNIGQLPLGQFFTELIGDSLSLFSSTTGIAALVASGGVLIGAFVTSKEFRILLIPIFFTMALLAADFIVLAQYLISQNAVLGTLIMAPLIMIYIMVVVDWLKGTD